jgi:transcriptional antiterminator RfaH
MPILGPEPQIFPGDLLDRAEVGEEAGRQWWAVHTRPRSEKALARRLALGGVAHYVPQVERRSRSRSGRKRVSFEPLFSGYAFVYGTEEHRIVTLESGAVASLLPVDDGLQLTADLRQIKRLLESGLPFKKEESLAPGTKVRITSGPFETFEGVVVQQRTGDRLLVVVNYLQRGVSIDLGDADMEPF